MADLTLTKADAGRIVPVNSGDTIVLRLEENPTTGYLWKVEQLDSRVLELMSAEYQAAGGGIGGGGTRKMIFRAKEAGASQLLLKCVRQWEPDNPLGVFSIMVEVRS
jgi:inhibitor of cysteine peptidase